jgi:hypothetical protein
MFIKIQAISSNNQYRLSKLLSKLLIITIALAEMALATGESSDEKGSKNAEQVEHDNFCLLWKSVYNEAHRDFRPFLGIHQTEDDVISADSLVNFPHTQCDIFVDLKKENSEFYCEWKYAFQDRSLAIEETLKFRKSIRDCVNPTNPEKSRMPFEGPSSMNKTIWSDLIIDPDVEGLETEITLHENPDEIDRKGKKIEGYIELSVRITYSEDEDE